MSLDEAHRAFEAGDFGTARKLARKMAEAPDEATRKAAADVLARTGIDPVIVWVTLASALVFAMVVGIWH